MLDTRKVKNLMLHKDDIIYGVVHRCAHTIQAAALKGENGVFFDYPYEYDNYAEIQILYGLLKDGGYTVIEGGVNDDLGMHGIEIYWNI